jgi:hypothetical protein
VKKILLATWIAGIGIFLWWRSDPPAAPVVVHRAAPTIVHHGQPSPPLHHAVAGATPAPATARDCLGGLPTKALSDEQINVATASAMESMATLFKAPAQDSLAAVSTYFRIEAAQQRAGMAHTSATQKCGHEATCEASATLLLEQQREQLLGPVVADAMGSSSAERYGMAYMQCHTQQFGTVPAVCSQLTAARWRQLAPGGLEPLVAQANEALAANDLDLAIKALESIQKFPQRLQVTVPGYHYLAQLTPVDPPAMDTVLVAVSGIKQYNAVAPEGPVGAFCATGTAITFEQKLLCTKLLERLADEQNSLGQLKTSFRIAKRLGWDPDKTEALRLRVKAINQVVTKKTETGATTCSVLNNLGRIAQARFAGTEMDLYRQLAGAN